MGIPTVCSATGEVQHIVQDGTNGFLTTPGDVKNLEETLEKVILNSERSKEIGKNGRKRIIDKYSYEAIEWTVIETVIEAINEPIS